MALYSARSAIAANETFVGRVREGIFESAIQIINEDPGTANHEARIRLARMVITAPDEWARRFAVGVTTNPNTGTGTSDPATDDADGDSALAFVIASIWDAYAGD